MNSSNPSPAVLDELAVRSLVGSHGLQTALPSVHEHGAGGDTLKTSGQGTHPSENAAVPLKSHRAEALMADHISVDQERQAHGKMISLMQVLLGCKLNYEQREDSECLVLTFRNSGFKFSLKEVEDEHGESLEYKFLSSGVAPKGDLNELLFTTFRVNPAIGGQVLRLLLPVLDEASAKS
ncbi:hypothetical protein CBR_g41094 [Chara braunii]|uniref:DUF7806 domain-containing protein n=1 Tax=Chara braunii TaxID=69332 RepID=A0A388LV41_CHABU|nr:hypothetical protein CBR_g41094 [Chara braunii]|eukprot:GBG86190.1 hypothetical protein CBR_g41094 [Chara braunii]